MLPTVNAQILAKIKQSLLNSTEKNFSVQENEDLHKNDLEENESSNIVQQPTTPESVIPYPKAALRKNINISGKKGKSIVYTSTSEKRRIEDLENMKHIEEEKKRERKEQILRSKGSKTKLKRNKPNKNLKLSQRKNFHSVLKIVGAHGKTVETAFLIWKLMK